MAISEIYSRPGHLIRRLHQIAVALYFEEAAALGVTNVQSAALHIIREVPNIDQITLSSLIAHDKTTIVKVLDRLVDKGLITRTRSTSDRRRNLLVITPSGEEILKQIAPMIKRSQERILAPLSEDDRQKFMKMLKQLVDVNNIYSRAPLNCDVCLNLSDDPQSARGLAIFYSRPGHLIRRLHQIGVAMFFEEAGGLGLTNVQSAALHIIRDVPDINQVTLSNLIAYDKTTIVKVLDRLVGKGLITRTRDLSDRRRHLLNITATGREILKQIGPIIERSRQRILAPLNETDRQKFMELLKQLVDVNNIYSRSPLKSESCLDLMQKEEPAAAFKSE